MEKFVLNGGIPLRGEVSISGAKNAVVAILPATILAQDICTIENIPNISDVYYMTKILEQLGAQIKRLSKSTLEIDTRGVNSYVVSHDMTKHLRASYYLSARCSADSTVRKSPCPAAATSECVLSTVI